MELVKVQLNEAMAGVMESYPVGAIVEFESEKAARLVNQGTANYFTDSEEVRELKEEVANLKAENKKLLAENKKLKKK